MSAEEPDYSKLPLDERLVHKVCDFNNLLKRLVY